MIYVLKGIDPDANAALTFGVSGEGADVVEIINNKQNPREAKVRLIRKLDRESQPSHLIRLTLTDGIISRPIVQDSTLYVGDENDETVRKKPENSGMLFEQKPRVNGVGSPIVTIGVVTAYVSPGDELLFCFSESNQSNT